MKTGFPDGLKRDAVLCILKSRGRTLMLLRNKEPNMGKMQPVGGKIEACESPYNAAVRETFEETGQKVTNFRYCGMLVETSPVKYNWTVFVYQAETNLFEPLACNEGELMWIDENDIDNYPIPETDKFLFRYIKEHKTFMFSAAYNAELQLLELREEIENIVVYQNHQ
jgi:8-oxo-dGTP diphosphatase